MDNIKNISKYFFRRNSFGVVPEFLSRIDSNDFLGTPAEFLRSSCGVPSEFLREKNVIDRYLFKSYTS
jgi:hypothetical protein